MIREPAEWLRSGDAGRGGVIPDQWPVGGEAMALRAVFEFIERRYRG